MKNFFLLCLLAITVTAGSSFEVSLEANATTGYQWQLAGKLNDKLVKFLGREYKLPLQGVLRVGQGGIEVWHFKALKAGKTTLTFNYLRPWEKGVKPVKTEKVKVQINP